MTSRAQHIAWARSRAIGYAETGELADAFCRLLADLAAHPETGSHPELARGWELWKAGALNTRSAMRAWIEGIE